MGRPLALIVGLSACASIEEQDTIDRSEGEEVAEGDAAEETGEAMSGEYPVTIESDAGETVLEAKPESIVSISPSATEVLFAIGAGDQVVAVDSFSTTPEEAPVTDLSGFDPNIEAIVAYEPDLVVASGDSNDLVASLGELDIPVLVYGAPADIEGGYAQMADLGVATDHVDETAEVISGLREDVDTALAEAPAEASPRVYHELDDTFFSASSFGFVGSVYADLGATNIADEADTDESGFPQLTEEFIIEADPQVIVITDQVGYTAEDVAARPGWDEITAVQEGNIITVNADIASRWGPRLPQFIEAAAQALDAAAVPVG
ncbi:ABC transporter substrate-binding protein [Ornithinimicrobium sp. INDO-MA30-4]|uniref:ABC transporter substrate-binding protein n=1 Tax=Ornithinimicrobium sp. INDO-MA30-4 TaxID=2908651 RepID=UPI001F1645C7|nr:helical backbone metal receptor [Ornithinimicrobium sp. INDO-MA30-4]UJH69972.1 helical backbone metal receptor [Ornithinimicrobium sp. INDO-MA30-4]